jgi:DNA polymerase-1
MSKNIIVEDGNLQDTLIYLKNQKVLAVDTETTGFRVFQDDELFSIQITTEKLENFYFNFWEYDKCGAWCTDEGVLDAISYEGEIYKTLGPVLSKEIIPRLSDVLRGKMVFLQNAKFDMHFLEKAGVELDFEVHDTWVGGRLLYNDHASYSLDNQAKRELGESKIDLVMKYMDDMGAYSMEFVQGKQSKNKNYRFYEVPFGLMFEYGCKDTELTMRLGLKQVEGIKAQNARQKVGTLYGFGFMDVYENEKTLTKVCQKIEKRGIKIDRRYCEEAFEFERTSYLQKEAEFSKETGREFIDSGDCLGPILNARTGKELPKTQDGAWEVSESVLSKLDDTVAKLVLEHRSHYKNAHTYFAGFMKFADKNDILHPDMLQAGTRTGRFSYRDPNLQNVPTEDTSKYPIRRAFVPREGKYFVMIDYKQMEFRLMLEYAQETELIRKLLQGFDPHQATADLTGVTRSQAKVLNFGILYGMGKDKLAAALKCTSKEAYNFKQQYFDGLPMVQNLIIQQTTNAKARGFVINWFGRLFQFPDQRFSYKATNALIQGGCADVVKRAMVMMKDEPVLLQIHDEILLEYDLGDTTSVEKAVHTMENSFPAKRLPLTTSIEHSLESWGDSMEGLPDAAETRNRVQKESPSSFANA